MLHLPPLRFHCVVGCWGRTQCWNFYTIYGARHRGTEETARQATQPGGIGSMELKLGLLKSLKILALDCCAFG